MFRVEPFHRSSSQHIRVPVSTECRLSRFVNANLPSAAIFASSRRCAASKTETQSKEELRRALTTAGGPGRPPPTAKDIDDLFTLFSCQTSAGVNGGRVDATTFLQSLRGDLSPARESVVRDVFRSLVNLGRSGRDFHNDVSAPHDQSSGRIYTNQRPKVGAKRAMNDAIHVEDLKSAFCKGGGRRFSPVIGNTVSGCDKGNRSIGGWFSSRLGPSDENPLSSRPGGDAWGLGGKAANNGVTVEQFLEHYRSAGAAPKTPNYRNYISKGRKKKKAKNLLFWLHKEEKKSRNTFYTFYRDTQQNIEKKTCSYSQITPSYFNRTPYRAESR